MCVTGLGGRASRVSARSDGAAAVCPSRGRAFINSNLRHAARGRSTLAQRWMRGSRICWYVETNVRRGWDKYLRGRWFCVDIPEVSAMRANARRWMVTFLLRRMRIHAPARVHLTICLKSYPYIVWTMLAGAGRPRYVMDRCSGNAAPCAGVCVIASSEEGDQGSENLSETQRHSFKMTSPSFIPGRHRTPADELRSHHNRYMGA